MKPYYEHGGQTIYNGDCLEVMKTFADKSFDLVLTDPPYGINVGGKQREREFGSESPPSPSVRVGITGKSSPKVTGGSTIAESPKNKSLKK